MFEKSWPAISPQLFVSVGGTDGRIIIQNTEYFKVKQIVILQDGALISTYEIKRVLDKTTMFVGPIGGKISDRSDISSFAIGSIVYANEQKRSSVPEQEIERLTYEEEPTVARRVIPVDTYGDHIDSVTDSEGINRLAVDTKISLEGITIEIEGAIKPFIVNVNTPLANTEYLTTLPKETKRFILRMRNSSKCYISYVAGQTTSNFITMSCGATYSESQLTLTAPLNIYFNSVKPSEVAEIVYWT